MKYLLSVSVLVLMLAGCGGKADTFTVKGSGITIEGKIKSGDVTAKEYKTALKAVLKKK